jgi:uncharacterized glyoxalase superfamily protein PhnB
MGKHRLVPHLIVDGGLDAVGFYERAFGDGRVRDPFGHIWAFHAPHKKKDSDEH